MLNTFKKKYLYYLIQFTWGLDMNILGFIGFLFCRFILGWETSKYYKNIIISPKNKTIYSGLSLGIFLFMDKNATESLKQHEYGHSIQNLIFGEFFLLFIGIPSLIRSCYYNFIINKLKLYTKEKYNYYSIWFERDASVLGERVIDDKAWDWLI